MRLLRAIGLNGQWRSCILLVSGMLLGSLLTSSLKFWGVNDNLVNVDKETLKFVRNNENMKTHKSFNPSPCDCPKGNPLPSVISPSIHSNKQRPTEFNFHPLKITSEINNSYLNPNSPSTKQSSIVQYLSHEFTFKRKLLVAVMTNQEHLKMANTVFDTWGDSANQVVFFVGEECNVSVSIATGLPLVRLPGVTDEQVNSVKKIFSVLKYISENYLESFHWVLLASDNMYVRISKLEQLLLKIDPSNHIYLGRSANGRHGDSDKLSLLAHEHYCLGSTGVVLSSGLIRTLTPHFEMCLSAAVSGGGSGDEWVWPDVELGRCASRMARTQCSQANEARAYFVIDYSGHPPTLASIDQSQKQFNDLIAYHPVTDPNTMKTLHFYYSKLNFKSALERTHFDESISNEACTELTKSHILGVSPDDCTTSLCPCDHGGRVNGKCPSMGVVNDPPKSYQPATIYDYQSWLFFDDRTLYNDKLTHPSSSLQIQKDVRKELQLMLSKAVQSASERFGRHLKFKRVVNGWVRHNPFRGNEYIVDCLFMDGFKRTIPKRVSLVRPLAANYITLKDSTDSTTPVHFIVPLANVNDRFVEFMTMYEEIGLKSTEHVCLVLVVYGSSDVKFVNNVLETYRTKYPDATINVYEGRGDFSRGKALHLGMSKLHAEDLVFLCDVDMSVSEQFIDRCRKNTIRGKRIYYPEFFKLYNLDYVYRSSNYPTKIPMKRQHGHWAYYSFGMLCIYKSDYSNVGGMNTNIRGWGEEDVKFFEKVIRKKIEVLRAPDTGLSHRWHEKACPKTLASTQYKHCLSSRGENLADRIELANYIYEKDVQLKYDVHGRPHNVQLLYSNETSDYEYTLET